LNNLREEINFSLWCDFIERDFLENEFQVLIENKIIQGATSNPDIFKNAIVTSGAYEQQISILQANSAKKIYEEICCSDIRRAAQILKPLHNKSTLDGFISLEVDPRLHNNIFKTLEEGKRLFNTIHHDNVMIKIPATPSGYPAMKYLTALGIPVNATLVFSPEQAIRCAEALNAGIIEGGKKAQSVISIFVSRLDKLLNDTLLSANLEKSKIGIINATKCYYEINKFNNSNIRTLFASTGVKDDDLPKSYYIDNLIFPNSVNTAPIQAIKDWNKNKIYSSSNMIEEEQCDAYFNTLNKKKINISSHYNKLLEDGLHAFKTSFDQLLNKIKL